MSQDKDHYYGIEHRVTGKSGIEYPSYYTVLCGSKNTKTLFKGWSMRSDETCLKCKKAYAKITND